MMRRWKMGLLAMVLAFSLTACAAENNGEPAADQSISQEAEVTTDEAQESTDAIGDAEETEEAKESTSQETSSAEEEAPVLTETFQSLLGKN